MGLLKDLFIEESVRRAHADRTRRAWQHVANELGLRLSSAPRLYGSLSGFDVAAWTRRSIPSSRMRDNEMVIRVSGRLDDARTPRFEIRRMDSTRTGRPFPGREVIEIGSDRFQVTGPLHTADSKLHRVVLAELCAPAVSPVLTEDAIEIVLDGIIRRHPDQLLGLIRFLVDVRKVLAGNDSSVARALAIASGGDPHEGLAILAKQADQTNSFVRMVHLQMLMAAGRESDGLAMLDELADEFDRHPSIERRVAEAAAVAARRGNGPSRAKTPAKAPPKIAVPIDATLPGFLADAFTGPARADRFETVYRGAVVEWAVKVLMIEPGEPRQVGVLLAGDDPTAPDAVVGVVNVTAAVAVRPGDGVVVRGELTAIDTDRRVVHLDAIEITS